MGTCFYEMQKLLILGFALITGAALALIYIARPSETAQEFAQRMCTRERESGMTLEKCLEARTLQHLAGRRE
jgi:hypothetical protein